MEHVARGQDGLSISTYLPISTVDIAISANDFFGFRIPNDELLVTVLASVELVDVNLLSCATTACTKCYLTQTTNLAHHIGSVVCRYHIDVITALVCHSEHAVGS